MSSIVLSPGATGAAAFTIEAPSTATSRVITLPDATDTLVGKATTDTLTNKSIVATQLTGTVAAARMPAGSVIQVVQAVKTDTFTTTTTGTWVDITGLSVSITPSNASNKILVMFMVNGSQDVGVNRTVLKLLRGSTSICVGDAAGSRTQASGGFGSPDTTVTSPAFSGMYLDSPATTSATTYKFQVNITAGAGTAFINRTDADADEVGQVRLASTITVMEIAV